MATLPNHAFFSFLCKVKTNNKMNKFTKALAAIMLLMTVFFAAGCQNAQNNKESEADVKNNVVNGHEYVDLGLPSGTLWATCNVGANSPEDYGDYFAWGETETKTTCDWDTYKYGNGDYDELTKYCSNFEQGHHGFTDNLTVLQPDDDAATANWGNGWCMPTKEQWEELCNNTEHVWKAWNGVNGFLFKGKNGAVLFLPAASVRWGRSSASQAPTATIGQGRYTQTTRAARGASTSFRATAA